ncbi:hypothetical protein [Streptomyces sp. WM6378]|uniref:hypothetical protein n=1 Tax=Streptomyces sp. WM6378 TaxID=1415557 RepID=UPI0006AF02F6|nr:hypothetical protein [Streptomyces sp. WM6378]KOU43586.1 hypothetical protein ADK54_17485 [Streptomyces sp. WM6378]
MAAALHLAHAHQLPPGPQRKRKDGDGGSGDAELGMLARRIFQDVRADHESKELLLALAYALTTPRDGERGVWAIARDALGKSRTGRWRIAELVAKDAPRYVSPALYSHRHDGDLYKLCSAPRLRPYRDKYASAHQSPLSPPIDLGATGESPFGNEEERPTAAAGRPGGGSDEDFRNRLGVCGSEASAYAIEKLPETGWHKVRWYCNRHRAELERVRRQLVEPNKRAPEPIPNQGGLMPCYFDSEWEVVYRHVLGDQWQPPVYGMRADDWPVPGRQLVPQRARLRLATLDGELLGGAG